MDLNLQHLGDLAPPRCCSTSPSACSTRWAFAEFVDVWEMQADFESRVAAEFERMLECVAPGRADGAVMDTGKCVV
ncbi:MAG: hypothetical protein ACOZDY_03075 [Pseudomonadota bacterium]